MKVIITILATALVAVTAVLVMQLQKVPARTQTAEDVRPQAASVMNAPPPRIDMRAQIRQAVAEARPRLQAPASLDGYLNELEQQARRNHHVSALEVEPGLAAIQATVAPEQQAERTQRFATKMQELAAELDGRDTQPLPDELARDIERAGDEPERQKLIRQYVQSVLSLPRDEQMQRFAWLEEHKTAHH
jgi:hypothetical protein